jgi:hypothetical protein
VGGVVLVGRIGTRAVVTTGLTLLASSFGWIALSSTFLPYDQIVAQMVLLGLGLGLTTAPASESILSVLPPAKAGIGSAVNDATREVGGTLGVAILGSIFTSLYASHLATTSFGGVPAHVLSAAQNSVASALNTAEHAPARNGLLDAVHASFMNGFHVACLVAAAICLAGVGVARLLPGRTVVGTSDDVVMDGRGELTASASGRG